MLLDETPQLANCAEKDSRVSKCVSHHNLAAVFSLLRALPFFSPAFGEFVDLPKQPEIYSGFSGAPGASQSWLFFIQMKYG